MLFRQGSCQQHGHNLLRVAWRAPHGRGRTRPALPLHRPTRDRCPLASDLLHNNTASFHFTLFTLLVLSSFMYSTFTFVGSDDIIYFTLANNYFPLFTHRKHHSHDRPPNCGERTGKSRRARSAIFGDPPLIAFGFMSFIHIFNEYPTFLSIWKLLLGSYNSSSSLFLVLIQRWVYKTQ